MRMIEAYLEWKAAWYFAGIAIIAAVIIMGIFFGILIWIYRKMCDIQRKRLEMMEEYFEEKDEGIRDDDADDGS